MENGGIGKSLANTKRLRRSTKIKSVTTNLSIVALATKSNIHL
jgi:hypothetical protein